jgi:hypothetical protein
MNYMKMNWSIKLLAACVFVTGLLSSCKKEDTLVVPPALAHFTNKTSDTYFVITPNSSYKVPVGVTTVASQDRTFKVSITSPTGAQRGVHYTVVDTVVVIPAGQTLDSIEIRGNETRYTTGRKDTLVLTIVGQDVPSSSYNNQFKLLLRGPCFAADIPDLATLESIAGDFTQTFENGGSYGPYTTVISNVQLLTATTGTAKVSNLYDYFGPVTINFDWTDPANIKVSIPYQQTDKNYAAGQPFMIRTSPGLPNTFSVCTQKVSLTVDVIVNNYPAPGSAAFYDKDLDIIMSR